MFTFFCICFRSLCAYKEIKPYRFTKTSGHNFPPEVSPPDSSLNGPVREQGLAEILVSGSWCVEFPYIFWEH